MQFPEGFGPGQVSQSQYEDALDRRKRDRLESALRHPLPTTPPSAPTLAQTTGRATPRERDVPKSVPGTPSASTPARTTEMRRKPGMPESVPGQPLPDITHSASTSAAAPITGLEASTAADAQESHGLCDFSVRWKDYDYVFPCVHRCWIALLSARQEPGQGSAGPSSLLPPSIGLPPEFNWRTLLRGKDPIVMGGDAVTRAASALEKLGIGLPGEVEMWQALRQEAWCDYKAELIRVKSMHPSGFPEVDPWPAAEAMAFPKQVLGVVRAAEREGQALLIFRPPSAFW